MTKKQNFLETILIMMSIQLYILMSSSLLVGRGAKSHSLGDVHSEKNLSKVKKSLMGLSTQLDFSTDGRVRQPVP